MKKILCFILSVIILSTTSCQQFVSATGEGTTLRREIIIDPGHGGVDGGAVGISGVIEKDVNLEICLKLRLLLIFMGYDVIMTRETDISIHDSDATTIRQMKTSDLHNRLKIADQHSEAVYLSIHQNNFHDSSQQGMCFYYSPNNNDSLVLAESLRASLLNYLQPENKRGLKEAGSSLFIMHNATNPAVLVECGFLSNPREEKLLCDNEYQNEIILVLIAGLINSGL